MAFISEKIVVTAKEFLNDKNINDCAEMNEPITNAKQATFNWNLQFSAASLTCEVIWKMSCGRNNGHEWRQMDKLFSPSPIATHANFRGCKDYRTGNMPEEGALVFWKRGNSWQGHMAVVVEVSEDKQSFKIIEGRVMQGSDNNIINVSMPDAKLVGLPFKVDKLNLMGFVYAKNREID